MPEAAHGTAAGLPIQLTDGTRRPRPSYVNERRFERKIAVLAFSPTDYLNTPEFQIPLMLLFVLAWLLGGGALLRRAFREHVPRRENKLGSFVLASLLAGAALVFAVGAILSLATALQDRLEMDIVLYAGALLGLLVGALMFFLVVYARFNLPAGTILGGAAPALGAIMLAGILIGGAVIAIGRPEHLETFRRQASINNLYRINAGIRAFEDKQGRLPKTLTELRDKSDLVQAEDLVWPGLKDRKIGYFYLPIGTESEQSRKLRLCEFDHAQSDAGRVVSYANEDVLWISDAQFQKVLALEENQRFAEAYRAAQEK
jgi:hypothetical protein